MKLLRGYKRNDQEPPEKNEDKCAVPGLHRRKGIGVHTISLSVPSQNNRACLIRSRETLSEGKSWQNRTQDNM